MLVFEVLRQPVQHIISSNGERGSFKIGDRNYVVDIIPTGPGAIEVSFVLVDHNQGAAFSVITNTGNEFQVFSTIVDIVAKLITSKSYRQITFASDLKEPTRVKLYDRMVSRIASRFPGWKSESEIAGHFKEYTLIDTTKEKFADDEFDDIDY